MSRIAGIPRREPVYDTEPLFKTAPEPEPLNVPPEVARVLEGLREPAPVPAPTPTTIELFANFTKFAKERKTP